MNRRKDVLDSVSSVTCTSGNGTILIDLRDLIEHTKLVGSGHSNLRVVIEDVLPSVPEIDKRLSSPIFLNGIREF